MSNENLIHVKLEYGESLQVKSDILYLETNLLKILKSAKRYHEIRMGELKLKLDLSKKIRLVENSMKTLKLLIPKPTIPKILKEETNLIEFREKEKADESDLEEQLREIREKLKSME